MPRIQSRISLSLLPLLLVLAACGTPQEQCISTATKDLRVVDKLIAQSQANLDRGYAMQDTVVTVPDWVDCTPDPTDAVPKPRPKMCLVQQAQTVQKPVAIDLAAEKAKLDGLLRKRAELARSSAATVDACKQAYPE